MRAYTLTRMKYRFKKGGPLSPPPATATGLDELQNNLEREREKLNRMQSDDPRILEQSRVVDRLINDYHRAVEGEKGGLG